MENKYIAFFFSVLQGAESAVVEREEPGALAKRRVAWYNETRSQSQE